MLCAGSVTSADASDRLIAARAGAGDVRGAAGRAVGAGAGLPAGVRLVNHVLGIYFLLACADAKHGSRVSQGDLNALCGRVRAT